MTAEPVSVQYVCASRREKYPRFTISRQAASHLWRYMLKTSQDQSPYVGVVGPLRNKWALGTGVKPAKHQKRHLSLADLFGVTMSGGNMKYFKDSRCPKCGEIGASSKFNTMVAAGRPDIQWIDRRCNNCGFGWEEQPLDVPTASPDSQG